MDDLIHVIDDDEPVRKSLAFVLDSAGHRARTYDSGEAFLAVAPGLASGCVVTDVRMPGMNGLELIRALQAIRCPLPVIVMTGHGDVPLAVEAMKAGVVEFLEKPFGDDVFLNAVDLALNRGVREAQEDAETQKFKAMLSALSPRETQTLLGVVAGHSNKVIARDLGLSPRTVEVYRAHVMSKTGAATLSDLVRIAILAQFHG